MTSVYLVEKSLKLSNLSLWHTLLMALVQEEMQRSHHIVMKFNRLKKKKEKRKQHKQTPSMKPEGKKTSQQQNPP